MRGYERLDRRWRGTGGPRVLVRLFLLTFLAGMAAIGTATVGPFGSAAAGQALLGGEVSGRLTDAAGEPVAEIEVDLFTGAVGAREQFLGSTTTDGDGRYRFDVDAGCYVATIISPFDQAINGSRWFQIGGCIADGESLLDLDAAFDPERDAVFGGVVIEADGSGAAGMRVDLFEATADGSRGTWIRQIRTTFDGSFRTEVIGGCYVVTIFSDDDRVFDGSMWFQATGCVQPGGTFLGIEAAIDLIVRPPLELGGQVTESDFTTPVAGVQVDLFTRDDSGGRGLFVESALTDADGDYVFVVPEGRYWLTYIAPDGATFLPRGERFLSTSRWLRWPTPLLNNRAALVYDDQLPSMSGTVRSSVGDGVEGVQVDFYQEDESGERGPYVSSGVTDGDGRFTAELAVGCFWVVFVAPDGDGFEGAPYFERQQCLQLGDRIERIDADLDRPRAAVQFTAFFPDNFPREPVYEGPVGTQARLEVLVIASPTPTVPVSVELVTVDGSATAGEDYEPVRTTIEFPVGEGRATVWIPVIGDDIEESNEELLVRLQNPSPGGVAGGRMPIGTILDDDAIRQIDLSSSYPQNTEGGSILYTVSLSTPALSPISVDVTSTDVTASVEAGDYQPVSTTVTIPAGELQQTIRIYTLDDEEEELDETYLLTLSNPSEGAVIGRGSLGLLIRDNDRPTSFDELAAEAPPEVFEGDRFVVELSGHRATDPPKTVRLRAIPLTASPSEVPVVNEIIELLPNQSNRLEVQLPDDAEIESDEAFAFILSDPSTGLLIRRDATVVTILDNDGGRNRPALVYDRISQPSADEGRGFVSIPYELDDHQFVEPPSVDVTTVDLSATAGEDYVAITERVTIPIDGQFSEVRFSVELLDDDVQEPAESFLFLLSNPSPGLRLPDVMNVVWINDDDAPPRGPIP